MTVFLDTNVVIALTKPSDRWYTWAVEQVTILRADGPLLITDIVYAECAVGMPSKADLDRIITDLGLERFPNRDEALFRAGVAFKAYREAKQRRGVGEEQLPKRMLPDMIVGAFAELSDLPLVTANPNDFRDYFPTLRLIEPPRHST